MTKKAPWRSNPRFRGREAKIHNRSALQCHIIWMRDSGNSLNCTRRKESFETKSEFSPAISETMMLNLQCSSKQCLPSSWIKAEQTHKQMFCNSTAGLCKPRLSQDCNLSHFKHGYSRLKRTLFGFRFDHVYLNLHCKTFEKSFQTWDKNVKKFEFKSSRMLDMWCDLARDL